MMSLDGCGGGGGSPCQEDCIQPGKNREITENLLVLGQRHYILYFESPFLNSTGGHCERLHNMLKYFNENFDLHST